MQTCFSFVMHTILIDVIDERAINLLRDLETLQLIRLREQGETEEPVVDWKAYKGTMSKQSLDTIDKQLDELRDAWE